MSLLKSKEVDSSYWFVDGVPIRVGPTSQTSFWNDHWLEFIPLKTKFSGLFYIHVSSKGLVGDIGSMVNGFLTWNLRW